MKMQLPDMPMGYSKNVEEFGVDEIDWRDVPKLSIIIMIVGSRGAVPFKS
jgi:sterol 3beta-glucosyltransferase